MRKTLVFFFVAVSMLFMAFTPSGQQKYLPEEVKGLYIGMSMDSLVALRGSSFESSLLPSGTRMLVEPMEAGHARYKKITYLFSKDNSLYEIILEANEHFNLDLYMHDFYGSPNFNTTEWVFQVDQGVELYVWQYLNRWCIANGAMF